MHICLKAIINLKWVIFFLYISCIRKYEIDDKWKWDDEVFLPAAKGVITATAKSVSAHKTLCEDKSQVMAGNKMRMMVENTMHSFVREIKKDTLYTGGMKDLKDFAITMEILALKEVEPSVKSEKNKDEYECLATLNLEVEKIIKIVDEQAKKHQILVDQYKIYQKLKSEVVEVQEDFEIKDSSNQKLHFLTN